MRLLKIGKHDELSLTSDLIENIPPYAILSHTWGAVDDEVTFRDFQDGSGKSKAGYGKIQFCGEQARKDGLQHFWVDSCCIDKTNHSERAEAIISMFRWYRNAERCYVYLSDVSSDTVGKTASTEDRWEVAFQRSRWFTRGWTLQELLAPRCVEFFSQEREWLGDKNTLEREIHEITGISTLALRGVPMANFGVDERMRWAANRKTKRTEDKAYCLLGIFNVFISPLYGERENAFVRLRAEIDKSLGGKKIPLNIEDAGPVRHVPFDRMPDFTGRMDELGRLKQQTNETSNRRIMSILGLGGVGKSRLALELVYQYSSEHPQRAILWVNAAEQSTFEKDMLEIAKKLRLPDIENEKADVKNLVKQRLESQSTERWLMILDNADDETLWGMQTGPNWNTSTLSQYLPKTTNGSIIVTTRSRSIALSRAGREVIELRELSPNESVDMFTTALVNPDLAINREATATLVEKLAYLPLAIVQAVSFINMTQRPVQTYLELLDQSEEEIIELLSKNFEDPTRYPNAQNPVATTWLVSFDHIRKHHPLAATFLSYMACLHEKGIPSSLLPKAGSELDYVDAFAVLTGYSFVTRQNVSNHSTGSNEVYHLHRLVHVAARYWLRRAGMLTESITSCIAHLAELFPIRYPKHRAIWTTYLPHAQRLCDHREAENNPERYKLLQKMSRCFAIAGNVSEAVKADTAVVHWSETKWGFSNKATLDSYHNLGSTLSVKGDYPAAEMYLRKALEGCEQFFRTEDRPILDIMHRLAWAQFKQGRWKEAVELLMEVIAREKRVSGPEHHWTLRGMSDLAVFYESEGKLIEAEELHLQVIETRKRVLGRDDPDTLVSEGRLAKTYAQQGRMNEAEELLVQVIEREKQVLGPEHIDTLTHMVHLALLLRYHDRDNEAIELLASSVEGCIRNYGTEHTLSQKAIASLKRWRHRADVGREERKLDDQYQTLARPKRTSDADSAG